MNLSPDQINAIDAVLNWYNSSTVSKPYITLGGYAGTGKTTVVGEIRNKLPITVRIAYCAYTGKATSVLRNKLLSKKCIYSTDSISTIHSLIYKPKIEDGEIVGWIKENSIDYDLIIVDECSMVSSEVFRDLLSYGIPILCIGDHGQLPPISNDDFNLMSNPEIKLENIHRYDSSEDSPLLKVSMLARMEGKIPFETFGDSVLKVSVKDTTKINKFINSMGDFSSAMVICGFNSTRITWNNKIRKKLGRFDDNPVAGDRIICLKNNKKCDTGPIYNGMMGTILEKYTNKDYYDITCQFDGENELYKGPIDKLQFGESKLLQSKSVLKNDLIRWRK